MAQGRRGAEAGLQCQLVLPANSGHVRTENLPGPGAQVRGEALGERWVLCRLAKQLLLPCRMVPWSQDPMPLAQRSLYLRQLMMEVQAHGARAKHPPEQLPCTV